MKATDIVAQAVVDALEAHGLAIYKKKVFRAGRRRIASAAVTDELAEQIIATFTGTAMNQHEIAVLHNVNVGRVNEIVNAYLAGKKP